ncbi:MAG: nitroreductase family deazaflavin-dependent oxidoreductase, partial [Chloroflexi bacterium]|nr:nitroreductase family deazaflavin-dependent oxidoreductase [Chloroflexota bacterium]MCI0890031.1 nitroreductase family deazaflavin-dependent oxidoreductase [Chloroflexota bacterium]
YLRDGENMVVVASNGGNKNHPAWLYNIQANPDATAQTGKKVRKVRAVTANEEERARLWPLLLEAYQGYQDYEDETERTIQVVVLTPQE